MILDKVDSSVLERLTHSGCETSCFERKFQEVFMLDKPHFRISGETDFITFDMLIHKVGPIEESKMVSNLIPSFRFNCYFQNVFF